MSRRIFQLINADIFTEFWVQGYSWGENSEPISSLERDVSVAGEMIIIVVVKNCGRLLVAGFQILWRWSRLEPGDYLNVLFTQKFLPANTTVFIPLASEYSILGSLPRLFVFGSSLMPYLFNKWLFQVLVV